VAARRHAANEHAGIAGVRLHAHAVAKDCAAAERAGGIDGDDADRLPGLPNRGRQFVDEGALAGAWRSRHADQVRAPGVRENPADEIRTLGRLVFDEGNGTRDGARVARQDALGKRSGRHCPSNWRAITSR
jgi:hypothetical protein